MELTNDRIAALEQKIEALKKKERAEQKKLRDEQKKADSRRFYIIGEIVVKHFPELAKIAPGNNKQNADNFREFEAFLRMISSDEQLKGIFQKFMEQTPTNGSNV